MDIGSQLNPETTLNYGRLRSVSYRHALVNRQFDLFWAENPVFYQLLQQSEDLESTRKRVFNYLADYERKTLNNQLYLNLLDRTIARRCLMVMKNIFARRSEDITGFSLLHELIMLARHQATDVSLELVEELRHLFIGMKGNTGLATHVIRHDDAGADNHTRVAALRSAALNKISGRIREKLSLYKCGLDQEITAKRYTNRQRIMDYFGVAEHEWSDWAWQCRHVIRDARTLGELVDLTGEEKNAVMMATSNRLPFGITPYYLSLMDKEPGREFDHAVRAQVIPPPEYVQNVLRNRIAGIDMDFMGEKDTSPVELVTRRYPMIAILKPYNTCAQICVYCQRNWEISDALDKNAMAPRSRLQAALDWCAENTDLHEVLVTGGDPGILGDRIIRSILGRLSGMQHIRRIRIGTRVPVVLPMRITEEYADILGDFVEPGRREIAVMTHFEHPYEVTPDSMQAVQKLKARGIPVYNQSVFTAENARRFEMVALRHALRSIGVEPYYTFNTKGKEETLNYRVPIARLLQEQAEEARLTPGLDRTDEAVFNIPRLGKSYLRAGQDHEIVMVLASGARVYEFYPWDQNLVESKPYLHEDVPILSFLGDMAARGEDPEEYRSIWYYF